MPLRPIREIIETGGPAYGDEARRLAIAATSQIGDSDLREDLSSRLTMDLETSELEKIANSGSFELAKLLTLETLAEIERAIGAS